MHQNSVSLKDEYACLSKSRSTNETDYVDHGFLGVHCVKSQAVEKVASPQHRAPFVAKSSYGSDFVGASAGPRSPAKPRDDNIKAMSLDAPKLGLFICYIIVYCFCYVLYHS